MVYDVKLVRTFRELMETSVEDYGSRPAFFYKKPDGTLGQTTYSDAYSDVRALATYLLSRGHRRVAVMGRNCYQWAITYLAVTCSGGVIVPVDRELKAPEVDNILNVSECDSIIYTEGAAQTLEGCMHECARYPAEHLNTLISEGMELILSGNTLYDDNIPDADALSVLVFTSGTSGMAKGVMLSQYNICSNIIGVRKRVEVTPEDRVLSVLPLHHTYECMSGFLTMMYSGAGIAYLENLRRLSADMQLYKPTIFIAVPLILEAIYKNIMKTVSSSKSKELAFAAGGAVVKGAKLFGLDVTGSVYKRIFDGLGGKLKKFLVGAAPLSPEVFKAFTALGFKVYCGYGLTETSPVCIMHNDFVRSPDHMGPALAGVRVKLTGQTPEGVGEITVKGPNVMLGYYNNPELTAKVIRGGWFYTGDLATVDKDGNYTIVGRCKNMIVTKNGKKIFPEELEYKLMKTPFIAEALVYGTPGNDGDTDVTAEVFPDLEAIGAELIKDGITSDSPVFADRTRLLVEGSVKSVNRTSPPYKAIKHTVIRQTEFEKTTTKKIKRYKR